MGRGRGSRYSDKRRVHMGVARYTSWLDTPTEMHLSELYIDILSEYIKAVYVHRIKNKLTIKEICRAKYNITIKRSSKKKVKISSSQVVTK